MDCDRAPCNKLMNKKKKKKNRHIAKDCKGKQTIKKRKVQEGSDNEDNKKEEQSFGKDLK